MAEKINLMIVKIKKLHPDAVVPSYAKYGDAGMDLTAIDKTYCIEDEYEYVEYDTGLAFEIPIGYVGLVFPRSSISKTQLILANSVGVIDSSYRGPVKVRFKGVGTNVYEVGDRVAQIVIMPVPHIQLDVSEELQETERGAGGFGHTGN